MLKLTGLFFITAILYAAVGFGGGSTYNALLVLWGVDYQILPMIALLCNVIVVSGGTYRFARAGHINPRRLLPWISASIPAAWVGGYIQLSEVTFIGLLGGSLFIAGLRIFWSPPATDDQPARDYPKFLPPFIGAGLGLISGMVGIGGGIFLSPILFILRWDTPKAIAGTASLFILVNSLAGLVGQSLKLGEMDQLSLLSDYIYLFPAVLIGGQIGSYAGVKLLKTEHVQRLSACLIIFVGARLLFKWYSM